MQNAYRFYIALFVLLFLSGICDAQNHPVKKDSSATDSTTDINIRLSDFVSENPEKREQADATLKLINNVENLVNFTNNWKVKEGDDSLFAAENYDDSNWEELINDSLKKSNPKAAGIRWYRMHFEIDSALMNVPLAFYLRQFGSAAEVYLDGKYLKSYGKPGKDINREKAEFSIHPKPFAFVFSAQHKHVLAIRSSDFHRVDARDKGFNLGQNFYISIKHLNEEINDESDPSQYFPLVFFAAVFLTLFCFHLILFIYNRQQKVNMVYSMYCLGFFAIFYSVYYMLTSTDYSSVTRILFIIMYFIPLVLIMMVRMLHRIFYDRRLKIFWFVIALFACYWLLIFKKAEYAGIPLFVLVVISSIEIIRVIYKAIRNRKDGGWIFAWVVLLAPVAGIVSSYLPDYFYVIGLKIQNNTGAIVGSCFILGLPFAMTLYLARDFSRINKKLKLQLNEITNLSEKTIRQEKERKRILENQKEELEIKVVERTQEVFQQKEVIEIKNKEITDSLVYAKRIQSAILPDINLIYKTLDQSFILYLPKDIVSGDFYAFAQKQNKVLIAAADCTGHGVAGAFMSMIGSALLNQIINEKNITTPSVILDHLNEGIIHSLKQKENETNDGMDISICTFDLNKNELQFAGANRPLWLIRKNELFFYKPNKYPIGGLQVMHDEQFIQHEIQLQKNDTIYIFTDGYADQFGGERGKKLMTRKFREVLLSIQKETMQQQGTYLKEYFEHWKGKNEQVDDVLVIGIRI